MISIIIPTRNRSYTLKKVLYTYYIQRYVNEIIIVDDAGEDDTKDIITQISNKYRNINTKYIKHEKRLGAAAARITGYKNACNEFILYGEDDAYLDENYSEICLNKIKQSEETGIVSGRIVPLLSNENTSDASTRFKSEIIYAEPFDYDAFCFIAHAKFDNDIILPLTHALILTKKVLLEKYGYDTFYSKGNASREESDFQLNLFVNNYNVLVTNDTYCYHMNPSDVPSGGQKKSRYKNIYWSIYYTNYLYDKYFDKLKIRLKLNYSKNDAKRKFLFFHMKSLVKSFKILNFFARSVLKFKTK